MKTGLFIAGGWRTLPNNGVHYTGLPSRTLCGPYSFRFWIWERHTAYEWAMALADSHPYANWTTNLYAKNYGDLEAKTIAGMEARESAIDDNEQAAGFYRDLKTAVETGELRPLRTERCVSRPGIDPPNVLDFTRYVFGIDQVLPIVRRRGDTGWLIGKLLSIYDDDAAPDFDKEQPTKLTAQPAASGQDRIEQLPKPERTRRSHEKRYAIIEAVNALSLSLEWSDKSAKERRKLIEGHLNKPNGWCTSRTYERALEDHKKTKAPNGSFDSSATSASSATSRSGTSV